MDRLEKDIKKSLRNFVKGLPFVKMFSYFPMMGENGIPDFIGCVKTRINRRMVGREIGLFFGMEVKRRRKKLTPLQRIRKKELKEKGGIVFRASSVKQLKRIIKFLRRA